MTTVSNSYHTTQNCNLCSKPAAETKTEEKKEEEGFWESFCNQVIAPAIEDAACSYIDGKYGTNLVEQKQQKELEEAYEKALADAETMSTPTGILVDYGVDELYKYADDNWGTNFVELKKEQDEKNAAFLKEAQEYKAQKEQSQVEQQSQQQETNFVYDLLCALFGVNKN